MNKLLVVLTKCICNIGIAGINNCCFLIFGQEKEPDALQKYKK